MANEPTEPTEPTEAWFDEFWASIPGPDEYADLLVLVFIGLLRSGLVWREGDALVGIAEGKVVLGTEEQYIVRKFEDAISAVDKKVAHE